MIAEADRVYDELRAQGIDVLYDDRDVSPGVKFADADLVGVPVQLVVGAKGVGRGVVERKVRATGERDELPLHGARRSAPAVVAPLDSAGVVTASRPASSTASTGVDGVGVAAADAAA